MLTLLGSGRIRATARLLLDMKSRSSIRFAIELSRRTVSDNTTFKTHLLRQDRPAHFVEVARSMFHPQAIALLYPPKENAKMFYEDEHLRRKMSHLRILADDIIAFLAKSYGTPRAFNPYKGAADMYYPPFLLDKKKASQDVIIKAILSVTSSMEVKMLCACMAIILPYGRYFWQQVDTTLYECFTGSNSNPLDVSKMDKISLILLTHLFTVARREYKLANLPFRSIDIVTKELTHRLRDNGQGEADDNLKISPYSGIGSLYLSYYNEIAPSKRSGPDYKKVQTFVHAQLLRDLKQFVEGGTTLAELRHYMKEDFILVPNKYELCHLVYKAAANTLRRDVAANNTPPIDFFFLLLDFMVKTEQRDMVLVKELHDNLATSGSLDTISAIKLIQLLNLLVLVDPLCPSGGIVEQTLQRIIGSIRDHPNGVVLNVRKEVVHSLSQKLSAPVKDMVEKRIKALTKKEVTYKDLILCLCCFSLEDIGKHVKTLEITEAIYIDNLNKAGNKVGLHEVISLYHTYAAASRYCTPLIDIFDNVIRANLFPRSDGRDQRSITLPEKMNLLWMCARLNHKTDFLATIVETVVFDRESHRILKTTGMLKCLWSMAVLEILSDRHWDEVNYLFDDRGGGGARGGLAYMNQQLAQVRAELATKYGKCFSERTDFSSVAVNQFSALSNTHRDISNILRKEMGIYHENEKYVEYGYIVDIFIPGMNAIIEYDGPDHYESYHSRPTGNTIMKRRHLRALGYTLLPLHYKRYNMNFTTEKKIDVIEQLLCSEEL